MRGRVVMLGQVLAAAAADVDAYVCVAAILVRRQARKLKKFVGTIRKEYTKMMKSKDELER